MSRGWLNCQKSLTGILLTVCGLLLSEQIVAAQEQIEEKRQRFEIAIGTWFSAGDTHWAHNASSASPLLGNPSSKLTYKDVGTTVVDIAGTYWFTPRLFGRLNLGVGGIGGGRLTDDDYLAADGGNPSSRTISNLNGDGMIYLNADVGGRVTNFANHRGWLDLFGGIQFWHTQYSAVGLGQVTCTTAGSTINLGGGNVLCNPGGPTPPVGSGVNIITNTTNWYSIRLGGRAEYRFTRQFSLQANIALLPISILDNKDVHHLRSDLQQNPSISMVGFGIGADADVGLRYMFTKNIGLNFGYRVWWNRMLDGTVTFHGTSGSSDYPLTQFQSVRQGLTAGLNFTF
ncbi:MAG: hypothetical protein HOP00_11605 [Nitrospira sp.]|nr:hypothetical protein [Nitrospira sp.]